jgi:amino acid transporter
MESVRQEPTPRTAHFSLWDTVCIIVGIIIGTGIFRSANAIFAMCDGPWQALAIWVLGGLLCVVGAFVFAELASTYPRSGGEYVYLTRAFGSWAGFLFAWGQMLIVRTGASIVIMAYAFADFAVKLFDLNVKDTPGYLGIYTFLALAPVVLLTCINIVGVRSGKHTQNLLTVVKVLGLGGILVAGFVWGQGADTLTAHHGTIVATYDRGVELQINGRATSRIFPFPRDYNPKVLVDGEPFDWSRRGEIKDLRVKVLTRSEQPLVAAQISVTKQPPWAALIMALIGVLWTYAGWHEGAYVAAEVENKRVNLPRALLLGTAVVIVLYLLVNAAYIVGVGFESAALSATLPADVFDRIPGGFGGAAMSVLIMLSALGAINGMLTTNARIFAEFGNDHTLFAPLSRWSRRWGTPVPALVAQLVICLVTIAVVAVVAGSSKVFERLMYGTAPVFWLFFLATGVAFFVLRWKDRGIDRPFAVPLYPLTPLVYCGFCGMMLVGSVLALQVEDVAAWLGILLLGVPLYWITRHGPGTLEAVTKDHAPEVHTIAGK